MGMYTELHYNAELRSDTPAEVLAVLAFMVGEGERPESLPDHPLFSTSRWDFMLRCDSYYFAADTRSYLHHDIANFTTINVRCNLKNYDGEIDKFVDWLMPYVAALPGDMLGFSRYEENEEPIIIRKGDY